MPSRVFYITGRGAVFDLSGFYSYGLSFYRYSLSLSLIHETFMGGVFLTYISFHFFKLPMGIRVREGISDEELVCFLGYGYLALT